MVISTQYKSYKLTCAKCNISENMIFIKRLGQLGFRHWNTGDRKPVFKPRCGIINDKPPTKCPVCGSRLKQQPGPRIDF